MKESTQKKIETMKKYSAVIVIVLAVIAFTVGMVLAVGGFFVPPEGEISGSVLTFVGEVLSFAGAVFGINGYTTLKIKEIDTNIERKRNDNERQRDSNY